MFLTPWTLLFGLVALGSGISWFILRNQIKLEDLEKRVEPNLSDDKFSSHYDISDSYDHDLYEQPASLKISADTVTSNVEFDESGGYGAQEERWSRASSPSLGTGPEVMPLPPDLSVVKNVNLDLFESAEIMEFHEKEEPASFMAKLKGIFKRAPVVFPDHKEAIASLSAPENRAMARPAPVRTVALVLKAPEDQPYLGQEILEVAMEMNLVVGREGFLEHMTTTYFGDEPMYSIAHMLHPGSFNEPDILDMELPGLLLFAHIPGPDPDMETIDYLIKAAAKFGHSLGGILLNEYQEPVDREYLEDLYQEISKLDKKTWAEMLSYHKD